MGAKAADLTNQIRYREIFMRFILFAAACVLTLMSAGCARIGPGGAAPGFIYSDVTYPNELNPNMSHRIVFDRDDIILMDPVSAETNSKWIAFVYSGGDSGYAELMSQARAMGADGVMNVTVDTNFKWYLIFYAQVTTRISGIAYRYRRD